MMRRMSAAPAYAWEPDDPLAPQDRYVTVRGLRLYVREQGDGHPLLLINGLGGHADMWGPAEHRLSERSRTIVFDAPGTGRSSTSPVPIPLPVVVKLLTRVLDELGHALVDVAGYSLGGVMAQQFARTAPHRVRRLALVATSSGWGSAPPDLSSLALISTPARYLSPQLYKATSHLLDGGDRFRDPGLKQAQAERRNRHPPSVVGYAQQFLQGSTWSSLHWSYRLAMPTLVIAGARDRLVPAANSLLLAYRIPDSRLHLLPDEGHLMLFDPLSRSSRLLADFFSSPDHARSLAWRSGETVVDYDRVEQALRAAPGVQPLKALSGAYRAWVRGPVVKKVFGG
jgi:pimeloyl-ACP methyl ester carboxylesterase